MKSATGSKDMSNNGFINIDSRVLLAGLFSSILFECGSALWVLQLGGIFFLPAQASLLRDGVVFAALALYMSLAGLELYVSFLASP
jgi:hypothetical protein